MIFVYIDAHFLNVIKIVGKGSNIKKIEYKSNFVPSLEGVSVCCNKRTKIIHYCLAEYVSANDGE